MCLQTIGVVKPKSNGYGYKVFLVTDDGLYSAHMGTLNPYKTWIKANSPGELGFHIYATREKAEQCVRWYDNTTGRLESKPQDRGNYRVFKVRYRNATMQGIGDGGFTKRARVIVAQEIFVL